MVHGALHSYYHHHGLQALDFNWTSGYLHIVWVIINHLKHGWCPQVQDTVAHLPGWHIISPFKGCLSFTLHRSHLQRLMICTLFLTALLMPPSAERNRRCIPTLKFQVTSPLTAAPEQAGNNALIWTMAEASSNTHSSLRVSNELLSLFCLFLLLLQQPCLTLLFYELNSVSISSSSLYEWLMPVRVVLAATPVTFLTYLKTFSSTEGTE